MQTPPIKEDIEGASRRRATNVQYLKLEVTIFRVGAPGTGNGAGGKIDPQDLKALLRQPVGAFPATTANIQQGALRRKPLLINRFL